MNVAAKMNEFVCSTFINKAHSYSLALVDILKCASNGQFTIP